MKQEKIDNLKEQTIAKSNLPPIKNNLKADLRETEEQEEELTFQRRPQFRINENSKRRFD